jgi:hypothetical protein
VVDFWLASFVQSRFGGARRPDQLAPVRDVMGWTLDGSGMRKIDRIRAETIKDEVGPEFMAPQP